MTHSEEGERADAKDPQSAADDAGYLRLLRERFPHVQDLSLRLLMRHAIFRELCEEYQACTAVLQRLTRTSADESMRSEYTALSLRLEGELLRYIGEHDVRPQR
ncbi:MAG TPA: hypothetical protein VIT67_15390 [Povalibacter sp.]